MRSLSYLIILTLLLPLASCNKDQEEMGRALEKKLKSTINDLSKNPSQPIEEIKKLHQVEYKTIVFPIDEDAAEIDRRLNELGQDRWQCFSSFVRPMATSSGPEIVVLCKRTPETVLRFVPNSILGR